MKRPLRNALLALAAAAALLMAGAGVLVARFDGEALAALLAERMQRDHDRRLRFDGGLALGLWPRLAVRSGALSLSEPGSEQVAVQADALRLAVDLLPLLRRQLVVDRVELDGLRATLTRHADGRTSFDDLLAPRPDAGGTPAATGGPPFTLALAGLRLRDATLVLDDRRAGRRWTLDALQAETGALATGAPAALQLQARLRADRPPVDAAVTLAGQVLVQAATGSAAMRISSPQLALTLDGTVAGAALRASLSTPLTLDLGPGTLALPELVLALTLPRPGADALVMQARGDAELALSPLSGAARLAGRLDDGGFEARLRLHDAASPALDLALSLDRLDLDRHLGAAAPAGAPAGATGTGPGLPDLRALRELDAAGELSVRQFGGAGLKAADLRLRWRALGGRLVVDPLAATLYQGRLSGSAALTAEARPRATLRGRLDDVAVGPLLHDLLGRAPLEGRGDVVLDLSASGGDAAALARSLAGSGRVELRDGLVRGVNVAQVLRQVGAAVGGRVAEHTGTGSAAQSTDFSALTGSFTVQGGMLRNDDLAVQAPLLRVAGAGTVDLGAGRLDYLLRASVVESLQGQGGAELQALRGLTLPVRLSGPLDAVRYRVELEALLEERARQALREKGRAVEDRAKQELGDKLRELLRR